MSLHADDAGRTPQVNALELLKEIIFTGDHFAFEVNMVMAKKKLCWLAILLINSRMT